MRRIPRCARCLLLVVLLGTAVGCQTYCDRSACPVGPETVCQVAPDMPAPLAPPVGVPQVGSIPPITVRAANPTPVYANPPMQPAPVMPPSMQPQYVPPPPMVTVSTPPVAPPSRVRFSVVNMRQETAMVFQVSAEGELTFVDKVPAGQVVDLDTTVGTRWTAVFSQETYCSNYRVKGIEGVWLIRSTARPTSVPSVTPVAPTVSYSPGALVVPDTSAPQATLPPAR